MALLWHLAVPGMESAPPQPLWVCVGRALGWSVLTNPRPFARHEPRSSRGGSLHSAGGACAADPARGRIGREHRAVTGVATDGSRRASRDFLVMVNLKIFVVFPLITRTPSIITVILKIIIKGGNPGAQQARVWSRILKGLEKGLQ